MKVFLHIGDARTGTTSLQAFFAKNRGQLRAHGVDYPEIEKSVAQHTLAFSLLDEWPKFAEKARVSREEAWGSLRKHMAENNSFRATLLSSEGFCRVPTSGIRFTRDFFGAHEVVPIFIRRDPKDRNRSWLEHLILRGTHVKNREGQDRDLSVEKIARWSEFFDVKVIPYSQTYTDEVLDLLGVDASAMEQVERRNSRIPEGAIDLLNSLNSIPMTEENRALFNKKIAEWASKE